MRILAALAPMILLSAAPQEGTSRLLDVLLARHAREGDPSDVRAAAARLGFDRDKIRAFVRDSIGTEPYAGILRDARGTLLAGRGNALDRALLLAALLEAGGEKTRLMRGEAPAPAGFELKDAPPRPPADPKDVAAELGADEADVRALLEEARREEDALLAEVLEAGRARGPELLKLAGPGEAAAPAPGESAWVQAWDVAKNAWEDLDAPAGAKGRPWTAAELAAQRRSITIRLSLRRTSGDPVEILRVPLDAAAVAWKGVELGVFPGERDLPKAEKLLELPLAERVAALKKVKIFRPGLVVDGKAYGGQPFDLDGKVYEVGADGRTGPAKELARGLGQAFGGAFGGGGEKAASALAGLDLEIVQKEPGRPDRVHRRALLAPARDAKALPVLKVALLVDGAAARPGERARFALAVLARNAKALRAVLEGRRDGPPPAPSTEPDPLLLRFVDLRRRALRELAGGKPFAQDGLGLTASSRQLFLDEAAGAVFERRGIDLIDNPIWIPGDPTSSAALGAADTALEALLLARLYPGSTSHSAWTILERERLLKGAPASTPDGARVKLAWSDAAWWSVEPGRGRVVGRGSSGAGQGMVEYAWEQASNICSYADLASVFTMAPGPPQTAKDANDLYGQMCSIVGGTFVRDQVKGKIDQLTQDLWAGAIQALGGL